MAAMKSRATCCCALMIATTSASTGMELGRFDSIFVCWYRIRATKSRDSESSAELVGCRYSATSGSKSIIRISLTRRPVRISSISAWKAWMSPQPPSLRGRASRSHPSAMRCTTSSSRTMSSLFFLLVGRGLSSGRNRTQCSARSVAHSACAAVASSRWSYIHW
jgi:hypothetical protein